MAEPSSKPRRAAAKHPSTRRPRTIRKVSQDIEKSLIQIDPEMLGLIRLVAQLLVDTGIDVTLLQHYLEKAYVLASSKSSKFRNTKPNQSAIAAMTGLSRAEVKRILNSLSSKADEDGSIQPRGVNKVIQGWLTDREFSTNSRLPLELSRGVGSGTFDALVARYGNDIPVAAVLRELKRRNYVTSRENHVAIEARPRANQLAPAARRFLDSARQILEQLTGGNGNKSSLDTQSVHLELQGPISQKFLRAHLAKAVPIFFEQARIAASGEILPPRRRGRARKGQVVRLELISLTTNAESGDS